MAFPKLQWEMTVMSAVINVLSAENANNIASYRKTNKNYFVIIELVAIVVNVKNIDWYLQREEYNLSLVLVHLFVQQIGKWFS